jgi:cytochrome c biogenesis protein CcdA
MLQILIAVLAGVLTVASPCVLPLLPILLGASVGQVSRARPLFITLGFVLAFGVVGVIISVASQHSGAPAQAVRDVAAACLALFGVLMVFPSLFEKVAPALSRVTSARVQSEASQGNLGGFVLGVTLGFVWTPCAGPVLASILALVATQRDVAASVILLVAYSVGAGVPMLLIAYGGQYATAKVRVLERHARLLQQVFGVLIIALAVAVYLQLDTQFYAWLLQRYPGFNPRY